MKIILISSGLYNCTVYAGMLMYMVDNLKYCMITFIGLFYVRYIRVGSKSRIKTNL